MADLIIVPSLALILEPPFAPTPKAAKGVVEFFTAGINNDHTRKAYVKATRRFAAWCEDHCPGTLRGNVDRWTGHGSVRSG